MELKEHVPAKGQIIAPSIRFWAKVQKTRKCWLWTAATVGGYGVFTPAAGKLVKAHRFAWEEANGPIPAGKMLCHKCDVRACVRPSHMFVGDAQSNLQDAAAKGRLQYSDERRAARRGEKNPNAVLTWRVARAIRHMRAAGATYREICRRFKIGMGTVAAVLSNTTWKESTKPHSAA